MLRCTVWVLSVLLVGCTGVLSSGAGAPDGSAVDAPTPEDASVPDAFPAPGLDAAVDATSGEDAVSQNGPLKAFPSAYGGGAEASGGRGGVLIVVNEEDAQAPLTHFPATDAYPERYEGGLYAALLHDGPAYIVFDRSMYIRQPAGGTASVFGGLGMPGVHDKTVFGQSAPRGGVTITGGTFSFNGRSEPTRNLVFRYLRSRPLLDEDGQLTTEPDLHTWGFLFRSGTDIVVDHCSVSFTQDKALGGGARPGSPMEGVTFSRNFVGDTFTGIFVAVTPDREGDPEDFVDRISFLSNLTVGMNRTPNVAFNGYAEVLNSVIYGNIYKASTIYHDLRANMIANYYRTPMGQGMGFNRIFDYDEGMPRIFAAGSFYEGLLQGVDGEDNRVIFKHEDAYDQSIDGMYFVDAPFETPNAFPAPVVSAHDAFVSVVENGDIGAYRYLDDDGRPQTYRDGYDTRQLEAVRSRAPVPRRELDTWVLPELPESVRPATYDTDRDGMADGWERRTFGDLRESYAGDFDGDGYTNIEEYMFQVDG